MNPTFLLLELAGAKSSLMPGMGLQNRALRSGRKLCV